MVEVAVTAIAVCCIALAVVAVWFCFRGLREFRVGLSEAHDQNRMLADRAIERGNAQTEEILTLTKKFADQSLAFSSADLERLGIYINEIEAEANRRIRGGEQAEVPRPVHPVSVNGAFDTELS